MFQSIEMSFNFDSVLLQFLPSSGLQLLNYASEIPPQATEEEPWEISSEQSLRNVFHEQGIRQDISIYFASLILVTTSKPSVNGTILQMGTLVLQGVKELSQSQGELELEPMSAWVVSRYSGYTSALLPRKYSWWLILVFMEFFPSEMLITLGGNFYFPTHFFLWPNLDNLLWVTKEWPRLPYRKVVRRPVGHCCHVATKAVAKSALSLDHMLGTYAPGSVWPLPFTWGRMTIIPVFYVY